MEVREWSRLIAPLLFVLELSAMSKLLSARSKPPSTQWGIHSIPSKIFQKSLKIFARPSFVEKILPDHGFEQ